MVTALDSRIRRVDAPGGRGDGGRHRLPRRSFHVDATIPNLADVLDLVEVGDRGTHDLLAMAELLDDRIDHRLRQSRDLREHSVATWQEVGLEVDVGIRR